MSTSDFQDQLATYRQSLAQADQAMQGEYDKNVLLLSGGALGVSFTFLKEVVGHKDLMHGSVLLGAWIFWGLSISSILASFFTSTKAIRKALEDTDERTIYLTLAKSRWATATKALNMAGGIFFFVGIVLMVIFVSYNLP